MNTKNKGTETRVSQGFLPIKLIKEHIEGTVRAQSYITDEEGKKKSKKSFQNLVIEVMKRTGHKSIKKKPST